LATIIEIPLIQKDYVTIIDIIDAEMETSDIENIWILNKNGIIIVSNDEQQVRKKISENLKKSKAYSSYKINDDYLISIKSNYNIIKRLINVLVIGAIASILFVLWPIVYIISKISHKIADPVTDVIDLSYRISKGDYKISKKSSNILELKKLILSLNETSNNLDELTRKLREEKENLRIILNGIDNGVIATDMSGLITGMNPAAELITGYQENHVLGEKLTKVIEFDETTSVSIQSQINTVIKYQKSISLPGYEKLIVKETREKLVKNSYSPLKDENEELRGVVVVIQDVSETYVLEQKLLQSQKMETVGRLAGGIAHDFNNLLTAIIGVADLASMGLKDDNPLRNDFKEILENGTRAAALTGQLLAFSRRQIMTPKIININNVISNIEKMLRRIIGEEIELWVVECENIWEVEADPNQIEQVIVNLVVNARDAMPSGGKLVIETKCTTLGTEWKQNYLDLPPGKYVEFAVSDTGTGMSEEVQLKIFEPFYTTKGEGKGTGLGLATVFGIIKQSKGQIWVYSEPDVGTTFKVYLPMTLSKKEVAEEVNVHSDELKGDETILLVEDEEVVRRITNRILQNYGYKTVEAENGDIALIQARKMKKQPDLVLTDVIMPKMNGADLANHLKELWPGIKILFMSGYTDEAISHYEILEKESKSRFIEKPFQPAELAKKIRGIIEENN
jgi:two-component system, cell cycle sensor histidine kinase and response regulator CckA